MPILLTEPVSALMSVLEELFARAGIVGVTCGSGVIPVAGWLSPHNALPVLLDRAEQMHDALFPMAFPYRLSGGHIVATPGSFLQYMAAIQTAVLVVGMVLDEHQDSGQVDSFGILRDDGRFYV